MGKWVDHCYHCRPSSELKEFLHSIVSSAPDDWEFEVVTENNSLSGPRGMPRLEGTFMIGAYQPVQSPVIPMLYMAFMDDESYILSIKADHNVCAIEGPAADDREPELLSELRENIWTNHNTFLDWERTSSSGSLSISAFRFTTKSQEDAEEQFMEAIDLINEKGWTP